MEQGATLYFRNEQTVIERGDMIVLYSAIPAVSIIRDSENLKWSRTGETDQRLVDDKIMFPGVSDRAAFALFCEFLAASIGVQAREMFPNGWVDRNIFAYRLV